MCLATIAAEYPGVGFAVHKGIDLQWFMQAITHERKLYLIRVRILTVCTSEAAGKLWPSIVVAKPSRATSGLIHRPRTVSLCWSYVTNLWSCVIRRWAHCSRACSLLSCCKSEQALLHSSHLNSVGRKPGQNCRGLMYKMRCPLRCRLFGSTMLQMLYCGMAVKQPPQTRHAGDDGVAAW